MHFSPLLILIFSLATLDSIDATSCIDGFVLVNGAKCVKLVTDHATRDAARRECNLMGGHLVTINNQIDNNAIFKMAISSNSPVWLGIKCTNGATLYDYSCNWADYSYVSYTNFYQNYPNSTHGSCVYMSNQIANQGNWFNGDCNQTKTSYICETNVVGTCANQNNEYCYWTIGELTKDEAVNACAKTCGGQIVSIHNYYENQNLYYNVMRYNDGTLRYVRIGAQLSSNNLNSWIDNSTWDYSNIGYQNSDVGSCYSISMKDQEVAQGKWISSDCSHQLPSFCKRLATATCAPTPDTPTQCTTPTYLSSTNASLVESPNYPYPYCTNPVGPCYYVLTGLHNTTLNIRFPVFNLDANSTIDLYSSFDDTTPFQTLTKTSSSGSFKWYSSPSNLIKLVFNDKTTDCNSTSAVYSWKAEFQPTNPNVCGTASHSTPGHFTSPNYPAAYPKQYTCDYYITSKSNKRVQIRFDEYYLALGDYIYVFEGNTPSNAISTISGSGVNKTVTTSLQTSMMVRFSSYGSYPAQFGFTARYYDA